MMLLWQVAGQQYSSEWLWNGDKMTNCMVLHDLYEDITGMPWYISITSGSGQGSAPDKFYCNFKGIKNL